MNNNYNITIGHLIKFMSGVALGPVLVTGYFLNIGTTYHLGQDIFFILLITNAICYGFEYYLEVANGYRADILGEKVTIICANLFRIFYFIAILSCFLMVSVSPISFFLLLVLAKIMFAFSYTLQSGNFEEWLQKQCNEKNSLTVFSYNSALFFLGLMGGVAYSIFLLPSEQYETAFYGIATVYSISFITCLISIILVLMMRNTKAFAFNDIWLYIASFLKTDASQRKEVKQNIKTVHKELIAHPKLNKIFWVQAYHYCVDVTLEILITAYVLVSQNFNIQQKFILLIFCYLLPSAIGAASKAWKKSESKHTSMSLLYKETILFFVVSILLAIICSFPFGQTAWYLDPTFLMFGAAIVTGQMLTGRLMPHFYDYCSDLAQQYSELPKTMLSIGERRKKIGAIICLLLSSIAVIFDFSEAYFIAVAILSLLGIGYSVYVFRDIIGYSKKKEISETV